MMKHTSHFWTAALTAALLVTSIYPARAVSGMDALEQTSEIETSIETTIPDDYATASIAGWPEAPLIQSGAAVLIEAETGTVLYGKNMDQHNYPASITKILTALLAIENCSLNEMVTFSDNAVFSIPRNSSHIAITPNEELTVENCLYGLLLASANEVANALAEHISGTTEAFAQLMNERAAAAGAKNTHFSNPSGLPDENHYTTCYDMAMIGRAAIHNDTFLKIDGTTSYIIPPTNLQPEERPVNSLHGLLINGSRHYDGCFGGKTGYTEAAGNTLVTFAQRNGMTLICVVMRSEQIYEYVDSAALLDYGFNYFKKWNISENETKYTFQNDSFFSQSNPLFDDSSMEIGLSQNDVVILPISSDFSSVESSITYNTTSKEDGSESSAGDISELGTIEYTYQGHYVGSAALEISHQKENIFSFSSVSETEEPTAEESSSSATIEENPTQNTKLASKTSKKHVFQLNIWYVIGAVALIALVIAFAFFWRMTAQQRARYKRIRRQRKRQSMVGNRSSRRRRGRRRNYGGRDLHF